MRRALERNGGTRLDSIGVDSWGVDYALIGERGNLLENPYHYRDARTSGVMEAVFERVSRDRIYAITGIQFLPINTIYQLYAACRATPELVDAARALVTIPDLLNYWLTGDAARPSTPSRRPRSSSTRGPGRGPRGCSTRSGCRRGCCNRSSNRGR